MKRILSFILILCFSVSLVPFAFADTYSKTDKIDISVCVDDSWYSVKALQSSYENNIYLSMRSIAEAFSSSDKPFDFSYNYTAYDGAFFSITTGEKYVPTASSDPEDPGYNALYRNRLFVDGSEKKYYSFAFGDPLDLYVSVVDICCILDVDAVYVDENALWFKTSATFSPDITYLDNDGYFDYINGCFFANYSSGQVYYTKSSESRYAIASTTKLMTYLLVMEAVESGKFSLDDTVTISQNVQDLSLSENGLIKMEKGQTPTVKELITAMLVASSNESALALAEFTYGRESSFVTQMNRKAREMGLSSAIFYNCSGLPVYSSSLFAVKRQNMMSAKDLYCLASYILSTYPEIAEITSLQYAYISTFDYNTANSNPLVFNISGITGLKTGNTNIAGSCLVVSDSKGNVAVILGAEDNAQRDRIAEILFRSLV